MPGEEILSAEPAEAEIDPKHPLPLFVVEVPHENSFVEITGDGLKLRFCSREGAILFLVFIARIRRK